MFHKNDGKKSRQLAEITTKFDAGKGADPKACADPLFTE